MASFQTSSSGSPAGRKPAGGSPAGRKKASVGKSPSEAYKAGLRSGPDSPWASTPVDDFAAGRAERRKPRDVAGITDNLRSRAAELMSKAEQDGLFDALNPPNGLRKEPPTVAELHALFDTEVILGVWRRTAYTMGEFPKCLNGSLSEKTVAVRAFEEIGSSWRFVAARRDARDGPPPESGVLARLECAEAGRAPLALQADLTLTKTRGAGCDWLVEPHAPFRGDPNDLPVKITGPDGRLLCSNPKSKAIALVAPGDLDLRDVAGEYIFNVAWECSLMSAQSDDDPSLAFLDQYLQEGEDAAETPF